MLSVKSITLCRSVIWTHTNIARQHLWNLWQRNELLCPFCDAITSNQWKGVPRNWWLKQQKMTHDKTMTSDLCRLARTSTQPWPVSVQATTIIQGWHIKMGLFSMPSRLWCEIHRILGHPLWLILCQTTTLLAKH